MKKKIQIDKYKNKTKTITKTKQKHKQKTKNKKQNPPTEVIFQIKIIYTISFKSFVVKPTRST